MYHLKRQFPFSNRRPTHHSWLDEMQSSTLKGTIWQYLIDSIESWNSNIGCTHLLKRGDSYCKFWLQQCSPWLLGGEMNRSLIELAKYYKEISNLAKLIPTPLWNGWTVESLKPWKLKQFYGAQLSGILIKIEYNSILTFTSLRIVSQHKPQLHRIFDNHSCSRCC